MTPRLKSVKKKTVSKGLCLWMELGTVEVCSFSTGWEDSPFLGGFLEPGVSKERAHAPSKAKIVDGQGPPKPPLGKFGRLSFI